MTCSQDDARTTSRDFYHYKYFLHILCIVDFCFVRIDFIYLVYIFLHSSVWILFIAFWNGVLTLLCYHVSVAWNGFSNGNNIIFSESLVRLTKTVHVINVLCVLVQEKKIWEETHWIKHNKHIQKSSRKHVSFYKRFTYW